MPEAVDGAAWPSGTGKMARRIREFDWGRTPLGAIGTWPENVRTIVDLMLGCGFPMITLWGPELIQIYNDGYRQILADKRPNGLGQSTSACWPEVWHINGPIYERVTAGETISVEDGLYPLIRHGVLEDAWFTLSYSPLHDCKGTVAGVLVTLSESTAQVLAERELRASEELQGFLLRLSDTFRSLTDATEIQAEVTAALGRYLAANRVYYVEYDQETGYGSVARDYVTDGSTSMVGRYPYKA
ncbi:MAG: hypothetical protein WBA63_06240 [Thermomicrobiales bacterium]